MKYIIALLFAVNANASILEMNLSKKWNINGVPVGHEATSMGVKMSLLGTGTATKKLGVSKAKLFVVQMYGEVPLFFIRNEATAASSIAGVGLAALKLTFLRSVDGPTVREAIDFYLTRSLTSQERTLYRNDIAIILNSLDNRSVAAGDSITVVGNRGVVLYETVDNNVLNIESANEGLTTKLFSMFLGPANDADSISLKRQLIQDPVFTFGDKHQ
jgi:hypothetical protein